MRTVTFSDSKNSVTMRALCTCALSCRSLSCLSLFLGGVFGRSSSIFLIQRFYRTLLLQFSLLAQEFAALDPYYQRLYIHHLLDRVRFGSNRTFRISCGPNSVCVHKSTAWYRHMYLGHKRPFCYILKIQMLLQNVMNL